MLSGANPGDSAQSLTVDSAAKAIEGLLSGKPEEKETPTATPSEPADTAETATEEIEAAAPVSEDEPDDEEEQPAVVAQPSKHKVKIDGQEQEVTLEEALAGYSRTADYTRKTQQLAEERKTQLAEYEAVRAERQRYATVLTQLEQAIGSSVAEPDWEQLRTETPQEFAATWAAWQQHKEKLAAIADEKQRVEQQVGHDREAQFNQYLANERTALAEKIPEWANVETAKKQQADLVTYGKSIGFSEPELAQVTDHRAVLMLRKAMLYDQAQKDRPGIQQKIEKVKVVAPGSSATTRPKISEITRSKMRLAQSGSVDDAASTIQLILGRKPRS